MVIFNETFSPDKTIYYPSTWGSGKTYHELDAEFKLSTTYFYLSNLFEIISSFMWIFVLGVLVISGKQLYRLYMLKDTDREKMENKKFLKGEFLICSGVLAVMAIFVTTVIIFDSEWTRNAFIKGLVAWSLFFAGKFVYPKAKPIIQQMKEKWAQRNQKEHAELSQEQMTEM